MSYLVFCSYEVGAIPFKIAEILNRFGYCTYYISADRNASGHDSDKFHYTNVNRNWNLTPEVIVSIDDGKLVDKIRDIKLKYNITHCFATGHKSFLLAKAGIKYCYWSYGSDLDQVCFYEPLPRKLSLFNRMLYFISLNNISSTLRIMKLRNGQIKSIQDSDKIMISPYQYDDYVKICNHKKMFFLPHILSTTDYADLMKSKIENRRLVKDEIGTDRFFFSATRHVWSGTLSKLHDNKANNIAIEAFALYLKLSGDIEAKLVLVEKGADVQSSKDLTKKLNIDSSTIWIREMPRPQLQVYYQGATFCFGQFHTPCLTFSALEPLSFGTPTISYYNSKGLSEIGMPYYEELPPIFDSKETRGIAEHIVEMLSNQKAYDDLVQRSWNWVKRNCSEDAFVKAFVGIFNN